MKSYNPFRLINAANIPLKIKKSKTPMQKFLFLIKLFLFFIITHRLKKIYAS